MMMTRKNPIWLVLLLLLHHDACIHSAQAFHIVTVAPPLTIRNQIQSKSTRSFHYRIHHQYHSNHAPIDPFVAVSPGLNAGASIILDADTPEDGMKAPSSTISAATFNLIKACVGSGVLALPSGLAIMSDAPQAAIPACLLLAAIGCLSSYTFYMLGKLCHDSDSNPSSISDLWRELVGPSTKWVVDLTTVIMCCGVCLTYSMVLGDFTTALLSSLQYKAVSRNMCILGVTATCLYPLARLPDLNALAPMSLAGVGGIVVTCVAMLWQWRNRLLLTNLPLSPLFNVMGTSSNPLSALVLMSMAATAFLCHFSAPDFLKSVGTNLKDYQKITMAGFASVGVINMVILAAGFLTFGGNCAGVILNSYAPNDLLASVSRFLMVLSVLGSYPFCLSGAKTSLYNLCATFRRSSRSKDLDKTDESSIDAEVSDETHPVAVSPRTDHLVTIGLLAAITIPSLILKNAGLVVSFNGATMGSAITYIFPSMLVLAKLKNTVGFSKTRLINRLVLAFGWTAAIAGGTCSILSAYAPHMLR